MYKIILKTLDADHFPYIYPETTKHMIPFFRKIRKELADDNRPVKYLRYAIGEIILVVIGILIALQINNWNEERKARHLEFVTLKELKKNIEADVTELNYISDRMKKRINSITIILQSISNNISYQDSLDSHFGLAVVYDGISFHTGAYESLKSAGIQMINDETLRFEIGNYYDFHVKQMEKGMEEIRDDFYNYMLGYLRNDFKYYHSKTEIAKPRDFEDLKKNESFIISLGVFQDVKAMNLRTVIETLQVSKDLLDHIDLRLEEIKEK